MIQEHLLKKYDTDFNFYCAKSINQIVYNQTLLVATIQYKDIAIWSERNEYLKRIYNMRNLAGRNEIYDRINMLADFYVNAVLVRYEHPLMIVTNTKHIFIKRLRRIKKMIASDCSSDQSSEHKSHENSSIVSFDSSGFLQSIKTRELSSRKSQTPKDSILSASRQFSDSVFDIYEQINTLSFNDRLKILHSESIENKSSENSKSDLKDEQSLVSHLIIDIDDFDKKKAQQYSQKLQDKNKDINGAEVINKKVLKSSIVITPIDYFVPNVEITESSFSKDEKYYPKTPNFQKKIIKKTLPYRYKQQYDETLRMDRYPRSSRMYGNPERQHLFKEASPTSPNFYKPNAHLHQKQTSREYINIYDRYEIQKYSNNNYEPRRIPSRTRFPTQNPIQSHQQYRKSDLLPVPHNRFGQNRQSRRLRKKQEIRQRAVALLHKVRSQQKFNYHQSRTEEYDL